MRVVARALTAALAIIVMTATAGCMAPIDTKQATGTAELDPTVPAKTASDAAGAADVAVGKTQQAVTDLGNANR